MENSVKKEGFKKDHPILFNLILMAVVFAAIIYGTLWCIDLFTEHGKYKVVPDIKKMSLNNAISKLESEGFRWEIADSVYNDAFAPGMVTEQNPKSHSKVKSSRTIYIVINAMMPRMIKFPSVKEMSERQAQAMLESLGIKNIRIESVYSPFKGLVLDSKINGLSIRPGSKIPASSYITLVVGNGEEAVEATDSLDLGTSVSSSSADLSSDGSSSVDFMQ